MQIGSETF
uniref:Uncharacterized protein n=1 Tax=Anguilla anguilla TaxID=7936 RepID=A0A0E9VFL3_ANGAN